MFTYYRLGIRGRIPCLLGRERIKYVILSEKQDVIFYQFGRNLYSLPLRRENSPSLLLNYSEKDLIDLIRRRNLPEGELREIIEGIKILEEMVPSYRKISDENL